MNIRDIIRQLVYMGAAVVTTCPVDNYGNYGVCSTCTAKVRCNMEIISIEMMYRGEM